jgi:hypothetical protein
VHNVKRAGNIPCARSACEQMPPASSNPTASTCLMDGHQFEARSPRGTGFALPASRADTWGPSQRPTNCRFGVLYCTCITFEHTLPLSLLLHNGARSHAAMLHQLPVVSLCQINKGQITEVVASLTLFFLLLNQSCMLMLIIKQRVTSVRFRASIILTLLTKKS